MLRDHLPIVTPPALRLNSSSRSSATLASASPFSASACKHHRAQPADKLSLLLSHKVHDTIGQHKGLKKTKRKIITCDIVQPNNAGASSAISVGTPVQWCWATALGILQSLALIAHAQAQPKEEQSTSQNTTPNMRMGGPHQHASAGGLPSPQLTPLAHRTGIPPHSPPPGAARHPPAPCWSSPPAGAPPPPAAPAWPAQQHALCAPRPARPPGSPTQKNETFGDCRVPYRAMIG